MYYVYVIQSQDTLGLYVGYTEDLKRRLREHVNGKCTTTSRMGKLELIHYEAYKSKEDAHRREDYLKTTQGKRMLKIMLRFSLSKQKKPESTV